LTWSVAGVAEGLHVLFRVVAPGAVARETTPESVTQLATRIPKELHHGLTLQCVTTDTSVMEFVVEAIEERLRASGRRRGRATS